MTALLPRRLLWSAPLLAALLITRPAPGTALAASPDRPVGRAAAGTPAPPPPVPVPPEPPGPLNPEPQGAWSVFARPFAAPTHQPLTGAPLFDPPTAPTTPPGGLPPPLPLPALGPEPAAEPECAAAGLTRPTETGAAAPPPVAAAPLTPLTPLAPLPRRAAPSWLAALPPATEPLTGQSAGGQPTTAGAPVPPLGCAFPPDDGAAGELDWWPPVTGFPVTADYGTPGSWAAGHHTGVDFATPVGTPVHAVGPGVVEQAGPAGDYGKAVLVRMADGRHTLYAHLSRIGVAEGDRVTAATVVGDSGNTGRTTGPHLHFEVRSDVGYGTDLDPERYLTGHGAPGPKEAGELVSPPSADRRPAAPPAAPPA